MGLTLTILALAQGLIVDTPSPDALCPDLTRTRETVHARLGEVGEEGYRATYTIVHERGDNPKDFVKLELVDSAGAVRLRRELPIGESCSAVADAIALVLERYFRTLVDDAASEPLEPEPTPEPAHQESLPSVDPEPVSTQRASVPPPVLLPPSADAPEQATRRRSAPAAAPAEFALELHGLAHSFAPGPGGALRFQHSLSQSLGIAWAAAVPFGYREKLLPNGSWARAGAVDLRAALTWGSRAGAFRPFVGIGVVALLEKGSFGSVGSSFSRYRASVGPNVEAGWRFEIGRGWFVNLAACAGWAAWSSSDFQFEGEPVLTLDRPIAYAGLGVGRAFSF